MTSRGRDGRLEAESVEATDSVPIVISQIVNNYKKLVFWNWMAQLSVIIEFSLLFSALNQTKYTPNYSVTFL